MSTGTSPSRPSLQRDVAATLAVAAFSIAVAAGYARVFSGWEFMNDLIVIVVVGHGVGLVMRRLSVSAWLAVPAIAAALVWMMAVLYYPDTMSFGFPTGTTWELFRFEVTGVREQFQTAVAPVNYGGGWDVLAAIGLAIAVLLADVFAFRALARAEALVPGGVLFVFIGALGDDRLRVTLTMVLIAVGVMTTAVLRSYYAPATSRSNAPMSLRRLGPAVVAVALVIAVVAGFVGPRLPGADASPLYETRGRGGGLTEVVNPLVDIRSRLTNQRNNKLFEVEARAKSYWRVSALPEFDGTVWGLPDQPLQSTDEELTRPRSGTEELRQQITIVELRGSFVPAAPDPFQASGPTVLSWAGAATIVAAGGGLETGDVFDIVSVLPRFDPAVLAAATATDAGDLIYTELPDDLPDVVAERAAEVTAGATSAFDSAILLQDWFRDTFEYSLEVQSGNGNTAIENFLRDRVGYCEQFAGTYAAMMRTLGIPTRVAVGFTPGTEAQPDVYSVLGKNAHAWPEVWFDDVGWVAFEPTPGRGAASAENYTGVSPEQDTTGFDGSAGEAEPADVPATTLPTSAADPGQDLIGPDEFVVPTGEGQPIDQVGSTGSDGGRRWLWLVVLALAALAGAPPIVRRSRTRTSGSIERQLGRMWTRAVEDLSDAGVPVADSQTPLETAAIAKAHFPIVSRPITLLADAITDATYRAEGAAGFDDVSTYGSSTIRQCRHWTTQIDRAVNESASAPERVRRYFTNWG